METLSTTTANFFAGIDQVVADHQQRAELPTEFTKPFENTLEGLLTAVDDLTREDRMEPPTTAELLKALNRLKGLLKVRNEHIAKQQVCIENQIAAFRNQKNYIGQLCGVIAQNKERIEAQKVRVKFNNGLVKYLRQELYSAREERDVYKDKIEHMYELAYGFEALTDRSQLKDMHGRLQTYEEVVKEYGSFTLQKELRKRLNYLPKKLAQKQDLNEDERHMMRAHERSFDYPKSSNYAA